MSKVGKESQAEQKTDEGWKEWQYDQGQNFRRAGISLFFHLPRNGIFYSAPKWKAKH